MAQLKVSSDVVCSPGHAVCDPHCFSDPLLYGKGDECMLCGIDRKEAEQLDREIVKRAMKWRVEAEARERAQRLPQFKSLAELEAGVK